MIIGFNIKYILNYLLLKIILKIYNKILIKLKKIFNNFIKLLNSILIFI